MSPTLVESSWQRIEAWLGVHAPLTLASLRPPADPGAIAEAQRETGLAFPEDLIASLLRHDGVRPGPGAFGLAGDYRPMPVAEIPGRWRMTTEALAGVDRDGGLQGSYWHPQWLLVADTNAVDGLALDCRPGTGCGAVGVHRKGDGTDFGGGWASLGDLLAAVADGLEGSRPVGHWTPVAFGGRLDWHVVTSQHPNPRSLLELAEYAREPAVPVPAAHEPAPVPEAGWIGELGQFCLTLVYGIGETELLRRYGAQPRTAVPRTRREALDMQNMWTEGFLPVVRVGRCGEWTFGLEAQRAEGARPEALRRLSTGTRAVALWHNLNFTTLAVLADGELVTSYDTRHPEARTGREPDLLLPELHRAGLVPLDYDRYPDQDVRALLEVLAAGLGIAFDGDPTRGPLPAAQFLPGLADPPAGTLSVLVEPVIATAVHCASDAQLRPALVAQARRLAAETGLDQYHEVTEALEHAAAGHAWPVDDDSALGIRVRTVAAEAHAALASRNDRRARELLTEPERMAWTRRHRAAEAIVSVLGAPPRVAAYHLLPRRLDPHWRAEFMAELGELHIPDGAAARLAEAEEADRRSRPTVSVPLRIRPRRQPAAPAVQRSAAHAAPVAAAPGALPRRRPRPQ